MKHMLMDPAFPDLVTEWANSGDTGSEARDCANDNADETANDVSDPLLTALGKAEIAATRLW